MLFKGHKSRSAREMRRSDEILELAEQSGLDFQRSERRGRDRGDYEMIVYEKRECTGYLQHGTEFGE